MNPKIDANELCERLKNNEVLNILDVREPMEFHSFNIGGQNIAVNKIQANIACIPYNRHDEVIIICKVGKRSKTAQSILTENGYLHARNLEGGLLALQKYNSKK